MLGLLSPSTAHEQGHDMLMSSQGAAYGVSYPLLGSQPSRVEATSQAETAPPRMPAILERIAYCESGGRQFDANGDVVHGEIHTADIGKYQINSAVWKDKAKKQGYDLSTEEGNEAFALELYHRYNTTPWESSRSCWENL